jgi:hypothetical protein
MKMKIKSLREHYTSKAGTWIPKRSFDSEEQIKEELGFENSHNYICSVCSKLHVASKEKLESRNDN